MRKSLKSIMVMAAAVLFAMPSQAQSLAQRHSGKVGQQMKSRQKVMKVDAAQKQAMLRVQDISAYGKPFNVFAPQKRAEKAMVKKGLFTPSDKQNWPDGLRKARTLMGNHALQVASKMNKAPKKAETVENGVITAPDEGTTTYYSRAGYAWAYGDPENIETDQNGMVTQVVETEDGTVYMKDIVSQFASGTWAKGTKSGNTITFPVGQYLDYNANYSVAFYLAWVTFDEETEQFVKDDTKTEVTFVVDGNTLKLQGTDEDNMIGVFYDYQGTTYFDGNADYGTVLTVTEYQEPSTTLVEIPATATPEEWSAEGINTTNNGNVAFSATAKVAFAGSDVYISGIFTAFPTSWIKGTLEGNKITFDSYQYLGTNAQYDADGWAIGYKGGGLRNTFTMTYDAENEKITADQPVLCNAATDRLYYFQWINTLTIKKDNPADVLIDQLPYSNGFDTPEEIAQFTIIDANGDGKPWLSSNGAMRVAWNTSMALDDWLISPAIKLVKGKTYSFSINAKCESASYPEKFEVKLANERSADALNAGQSIIEPTTIAHAVYNKYENTEITVSETGYYYFGVHAISDADKYYLTVDDFLVEAQPLSAPYTADFSSEDPMADFMVLDNNSDSKTWAWNANNGAYYMYNTAEDADDYLILPINLKGGVNYDVTVNASCANTSYEEKFEVVAGSEGTPEALTMVVIPETTVATTEKTDYTGILNVETDGLYYVAIHATSDKDKWRLSVFKFSIEKALNTNAPAAATLTATPAVQGVVAADVVVTAPSKTISDTNLAADDISKIELYRDNTLINTWENPAPGQVCTPAFTDNADAGLTSGSHMYQAIVYDKNGERGEKSEEVTVYVGLDTPGTVANIEAADNATSIGFTWDPVENVGVNGGYVDPAQVEYKLWNVKLESFWGMTFPSLVDVIGSVVGETSITADINTDEGEQEYRYFAVQPVNEMGEGSEGYVNLLVGEAYPLPFVESFEGSSLHYLWEANAQLGISDDATDGDGVALAMYGQEAGMIYFLTGKVDLKSATNPELVLDAKSDNVSTLYVIGAKDGGSIDILSEISLTGEYATYKVDLNSLKGERYSQVGLAFNVAVPATESEMNDNVVMDNIRILDVKANDLAVALEADASVKAGKAAAVKATVQNVGDNAASGYTVTIMAGDKEIYSETFNDELASFAKKVIETELQTSILDEADAVELNVEVTYAADEILDNNTATATVAITKSTAPSPENVAAQDTEDGVVVTWDAPTATSQEVTEDFESGMGGFTTIDADNDGNNWIHHINTGTNLWKTTSGEGSVGSYSWDQDALTPDNWLVSPKSILEGTFKFWAGGQDPDYAAEKFAVFVSTESATDVTTFEKVSEDFIATGEMAEYTVDLGAYAGQEGWIAIRHYDCTDMFVLIVDDVTYMQAALIPTGYNVYVDGELVETVEDGTTVTLTGVTNGEHTVSVTALYENGDESNPTSTTVDVTLGMIQLTIGNQPVDVYSIDGKLIRKQATSLSGLKGVYVINGKKYIMK